MTLYGEAKKGHFARAGIYHLAPKMVNEKSYWVHASGEHAIWFDPYGRWIIGDIDDAGKNLGYIHTVDDVSVPQKASVWKYFDVDGKRKFDRCLISVSLQN